VYSFSTAAIPRLAVRASGLLAKAAAYAEAGEFDTAIKTQKEAIELAPEGQRENCGEILKLYESQRPRRESTSETEQPE
jgi:hypothetical protein